jgi:Pro-kumamolisin, activation domain
MKNRFFGRLPAASCAFLLFLSAASVQAAGQKALSGHVPSAISRLQLQPLGNLSGSTNLHLAIGLPLHNQEALNTLLQQIYDPASTNYHHYLTPEQFTEKFGPTEQDYQAVIAFTKANGFTVTGMHSNRMLLEVNAAAADVEKAFQVKLHVYQHPTENRTFYAPDVEPSVPSTLPVLDISGLNNYSRPHPNYIKKTLSANQTPNAGPGSGLGGTYMGSDFRNAYVPGVSLNGSGQTVGLVQFDGYNPGDIAAYETAASLPVVLLQNVLLSGFDGQPTGNGGEVEVSLDIEMVISMAPDLSEVIVYEGNPDNFQPNVVLNRIVMDNAAKQISCSWSWTGGPTLTTDNYFIQMAAQGQSFFVASGDTDAYQAGTVDNPSYFGAPVDSPYVTSVGGTALTMTGLGGSWSSETVWNERTPNHSAGYGDWGSSGGISTYYTIPTWQQDISMTASQGSMTHRNFPDVAMTASNVFVIADNGLAYKVGGTSCASPLWAGFMALVNQQAAMTGLQPIGFINPSIYTIGKGGSYASAFHDITTGDNAWSGSSGLFPAVSGYDLCTGWGTPGGINLIHALALSTNGFLTISVSPPSGAAFITNSLQPIYVTVSDIYPVTNATVKAVVTNILGIVANLTFRENTLNGIYTNTLTVPASTSPLTMTVVATNVPGEIGATNVFYYNVIQRPANDNFANAIKVPVASGSYVANNRFATIETGEPNHDGDVSVTNSLWWSWMPTTSTNVLIDTVGSDIDTILAVYTGDSLTSLQPVVATNGSLAQYKPAQVSFNAQAGMTYRIVVASVNSNSVGSLDLHITPGGQPDTVAPVVSITNLLSGLTVYSPFITIGGTASDPGPNASGISQVFVSFNGHPPLTAIGTTNWTTLVALRPNLNIIQVSAVDEAGNFSSPVTVEVNYLVLGPPNDFFVNAIQLSGNSGFVTAENTNATREVGEPYITGNPGGKSLWWYFVPPADGVLDLKTATNTFDTLLGLYTGANVASLTLVADNDDATNGAPGGFSEITQAVRAGQTNYIAVDGYDGVSGTFSLIYSFVPATVYHLTASNTSGGTVQLESTNALGGVVILPGESANFASNSTVVLAAIYDANSQFDHWTNTSGLSSTNNPLTIVMTSDTNIMADFIARVFTDGFESGNLSHLPWTTPDPNVPGDMPWFVQSSVVDVGQYAAQSGVIGNSQSSSLILSNVTAGPVSFDFKVSSETNWDFLNFYVNGVLKQRWSGEVGWSTYTFTLPANTTNTLEWSYVKDAFGSDGLDAAFIDDVNVPQIPGVTGPVFSAVLRPAVLQLQCQPNGKLFINLTGQAGQEDIVQTSTNLADPNSWQNISTNILFDGVSSIPLPSSRTNQVQFYRVAP